MAALETKPPTWARIHGIDSVEWSDEPVLRTDYQWLRMETTPRVGQRCGLMLRERLARDLLGPELLDGDSLWVLYEPAFTSINGWTERPEEMGDSALVRCRWLESLGQFDWGPYGGGWGEAVEVEEVIGLRELVERFPPDSSGPVPELPGKAHGPTEWQNLSLYEGRQESVVYGGLLVQNLGDAHALVLYRSSFFEEARVYAGHRPLSNGELRRLRESADTGS